MNSLPFISILVMSHNQEAFIRDAVHSILTQEYDGELEFIFCDDHSTDATFEIIEEIVSQYKGNRRIVTHKAKVNGRVATNMNIAIQLAKGDWFMRVDGDDILHPDRVRLSAKAIMEHPNAVAVSGRFSYFETDYQPITNPDDSDIRYNVFSLKDFVSNEIPRGLEWWGGLMTMHRRIFDTFGPLPHECHVLDDTMFATRSLMLGDFVIIDNAVLLYYRRHGGNISSSCAQAHSIRAMMKQDKESRDYYRRGIPCHKPILNEIEKFTIEHPEIQNLLECFRVRFDSLSRQAFFWDKSWKERIKDAHISGPFWKKIPWALRVMCPFTYALVTKIKNKS
ncbi:MAG: glycosyltransferase [Akkermansia sp.]|nr:glycosyltransferase [Akkermansia sp.]